MYYPVVIKPDEVRLQTGKCSVAATDSNQFSLFTFLAAQKQSQRKHTNAKHIGLAMSEKI